jgi:hypothetical protein
MRLILPSIFVGLAVNVVAAQRPADNPIVVHEWGTITTHHAADGKPEGGLNRIGSDALPSFVHRYEPVPTPPTDRASLVKSPVTPGRPDVTMRLETPVMYFYPPPGTAPSPFDVSVRFRGGILNEFYPNADAASQAGPTGRWDGGTLNNAVVGSLSWRGVSVNATSTFPQTTSHVWLAPRRVRSAPVMTAGGESERYLFYRGVAHLDALMQTELAPSELRLRAPVDLHWLAAPRMTIGAAWLIDVRPSGGSAIRELGAIVTSKDSAGRDLRRVPLFTPGDYSADAVTALRRSMRQALVARGLFDDEADAMLATWDESYFRSPGLRVLYLVPREWIDYHLPVTISIPSELTRVLVGRIDLARP